jgi:hypothetical protein
MSDASGLEPTAPNSDLSPPANQRTSDEPSRVADDAASETRSAPISEPDPPMNKSCEPGDRLGWSKRLGVGAVRFYQRFLRPLSILLGARCIYFPTCSEYTLEAIRKDGLIAGSWRGFKRICRCTPFHQGGVDPP